MLPRSAGPIGAVTVAVVVLFACVFGLYSRLDGPAGVSWTLVTASPPPMTLASPRLSRTARVAATARPSATSTRSAGVSTAGVPLGAHGATT